MQLDNPQRQRRLADIVASLPDKDRADVVQRLTKVERAIARRHEQDADLIDGLLRILKSPHPQAERLRQLIKETANDR
jgi:hypothetical protein